MNVYVRREQGGKVEIVCRAPYEDENGPANEVLPEDDAAVLAFLNQPPGQQDEISDRQFFQELANRALITKQEALDAVATGAIPAAMAALIDQLPEAEQFPAEMLIRGATTFRRSHPMSDLVGGLYGWTSEQTDDLWRAASLL